MNDDLVFWIFISPMAVSIWLLCIAMVIHVAKHLIGAIKGEVQND